MTICVMNGKKGAFMAFSNSTLRLKISNVKEKIEKILLLFDGQNRQDFFSF